MRLCAALFALAMAIDLAGFDCRHASASDPGHPSIEVTASDAAGPDCLCCSAARAGARTPPLVAFVHAGRIGPWRGAAPADGIRSVPYRPPLPGCLL